MKKFTPLLVAIFLTLNFHVFSQVAINASGNNPDGSAMLDVSSSSKGFLVPRMLYLFRVNIDHPAEGLLVYQTNGATGFYYYDGTDWVHIDESEHEIDDLIDAKTGGYSVFLGEGAGVSDDASDNKNVAIGYQALNANSSGVFNAATGYQALNLNTASRHTASGYQALFSNTTGESNTASGFRAAYYNTIGDNNTLMGYGANFFNQEGSNNTILGYLAGGTSTLHNKSGNVFLGYNAGYNEMTNNKLYIENSSTTMPLIYGEFDNNILAVNGRLGIGTQSPHASAELEVESTTKGILISRMTKAQRDAIASPATGLLIYQSDNTPSFYYYSGADWVHIGDKVYEIDELSDAKTGGYSVFLGEGAGGSDDASDNKNVAVGYHALNTNLTGIFNTATGYQALNKNIASRHTADGYQALYSNTTGESNTASGFRAAYYNTIGNNNTVMGYGANYYNQEGSNNLILGYLAGGISTVHSKSGNIFLGNNAGYNEMTNNKLYIENSSTSAPLIYGEFDNNILAVNGSLGVGTQSPHASAELEVESTTKGILISRMTKAQRDAITSPATGLLIYQTDNTPGFYSYDGSKWKPMTVQGTGENGEGEAGIGSNYGTVVNNITGKVWLDRNLGATQVATSSTDSDAYGDLYQWGRAAEGHEKRISDNYEGVADDWIADEGDNAWDGKFIWSSTGHNWLNDTFNELWLGKNGENNPCPCGFRIPTNAEWNQERLTWVSNNSAGAFDSPLKLTVGGLRSQYSGTISLAGTAGYYWSSTVSDWQGRRIWFESTDSDLSGAPRRSGISVRCIKD